MDAAALRDGMEGSAALRVLLHRYALAFQAQVTMTAACNARHAIEQRLARWLLIAHDRAGADEFPMTHEFVYHDARRAPPRRVAGRGRAAKGRADPLRPRPDGGHRPARPRSRVCECYHTAAGSSSRLLGTKRSQPRPARLRAHFLASFGPGTDARALARIRFGALPTAAPPLARPARGSTAREGAPVYKETLRQPPKLTGKRVLEVEDESSSSMLVEDERATPARRCWDPARRVDDALRLVEAAAADGGISAAVLDINLDGQHVGPVADRLAALGVPFLFATGYGENCDTGGHGAAPTLRSRSRRRG
jgi:hypothetical protein